MTIDRVSPAVRRKLVNVRQEAMRSGSASVLPSIVAYARESPLTPDERCHLEMAAAELAYLDGDLDAALGFMSREATLAAIPRELRITVSDNRLMTQVLRPQSFDRNESRRNWDEKELRSSDQDFNAELVEALRAARTGKHFDALPQLRSYLVHAYWSGDWRLFRDAASELSREQLALGEVAHSAYCAMLACNEEAIVAAATTSATTGTPDSVRAALALLLEYGHLRQHARVVCAFLEAVADAVPDDLVDTAAEYLLTWTHFKREFMSPLNVGTAAWEALEALGARVSPAVAERALDAALNADAWREPRGLEREVLVKACAELVLRCSDARAESFALQAVTLAKPEHRSHDYQSVLRLLWRTSTRSQQAKDAVIAELFPSAVSAPASLLQLGKLLGRKLSSRDELNALATRFADRIRKQVTLMVPGEPVPPAEGFGHFSFVDGEHQVVVELSHCAPSFEGLLGYAEELSGEAVKLLITALIEMIASPFNLLANKSELVHYIGRFADRIEAADIQPVIDLLEPLARGEIVDVAEETTGRASDPLNPFKVSAGSSADLQGAAIVALSRLDKHHPGLATKVVQGLVASGLADTDASVRKNAHIAASWLSALSGPIVTGLLVGTRDGAPDAAAAALRVLASSEGLSLEGPQVDYLIQAIHSASHSSAAVLRSDAAAALRRLKQRELSDSQRTLLDGIAERLRRDLLFSVRSRLIGG